MNTKQALQHLIGEVWEVTEYNHYCNAEFGYTDDGMKIEISNYDENSLCTKAVRSRSDEACFSLLDFLQANTKEGE